MIWMVFLGVIALIIGLPLSMIALRFLLSQSGLHVTTCSDPETALGHVDRQFFSVILVDIDTPAPSAG